MTAPEIITQLVERFELHREAYRSGKYNETQLRREFLDPFFEALGWDVLNKNGYGEAYKDVIHEDSLEVEGTSKAPDYAFRIGGTRKFFVEAKKPSVRIETNPEPAFQLRRYVWSAKLPISILTDFEEFAVYECRSKPDKSDKVSNGRVKFLHYTDYIEKWDEIEAIFSREAVLKGSFDQYAESIKGKKGTAEVDDVFLVEIERWRELLARNIALRNPPEVIRSERDLNYAVQMTIDRIIFLRMCEDNGIEREEQLKEAAAGQKVYANLCQLFKQADARYNSGLFHFATEKDESGPADRLTPALNIDDRVLKDIIQNLYYPDSPYVFSQIPADILGSVYERFLGKVIRLTAGHQAKVEEKPEVRKAGGVYYTPTYIVEYIVRNTVGKLLEGKTPREAASLKIVDPACGSGSFLLGAYKYLLDWHLRWYADNNPHKWASARQPVLFQASGGAWNLTTGEKKRILLNNIHGVDIDAQAVEVTKLSLLLKMLEGENRETIGKQLGMFKERVLPDLSANIKCGNSLIGPDYYEGRQLGLGLPDEQEQYRVNAFDWQKEFAGVFAAGGFDAVIGNPPYVRSINLKESDPLLWDIYRSKYKSASTREWDIYLIFVEKGISLLKENGRLGYILPNKFLNSQVGENLRAILSTGHFLRKIIHFGAFQIFPGVTTYTCLLFLGNNTNETNIDVARYTGTVTKSAIICPMPEEMPDVWKTSRISEEKLSALPWEFSASSIELMEKMKSWPKLGDIAHIFKGTGTNADKVFMVENRGEEGDLVRVYSNETDKEYILEKYFLRSALRGRHVSRYELVNDNSWLIVPYKIENGKGTLVTYKDFVNLAPKTMEYLRECKPRLDERENGRFKGDNWYCYGRPQNLDRFEISEKIILPDIANRGQCYLDRDGKWLLDTAYCIVLLPDQKTSTRYILGILNSPILTYFLKETGTALRGGYFRMKTAYLNPVPIRPIDFSKPSDKAAHDKMVALVESMLGLHKRLQAAQLPQEKAMLQRQVEATDGQIDRLVYALYGLNEAEIGIVEGV